MAEEATENDMTDNAEAVMDNMTDKEVEDVTEAASEGVKETSVEAKAAAPAPEKASGNMQWYIIHALSGHEKKVAQSILEKAAQQGVSDKFEEVTVPVEEVLEMRRGKKVKAERKFFPGYILAKMELNDQSWHIVKNTQKVTGFLGGGGRPQALSKSEVDRIFKQVQDGIDHPKPAVLFEIGESVKVTDGPFESFTGIVEDIDEEKARLKLSVSIFGRATPVDLEFAQVEKV